MRCTFLGKKGTWREIANSANTTIGKDAGEKEPSESWKKRMLLCEHSPIRQLIIKAKWYELKYWVSVHFVRHWLGITHWVSTQRPDRQLGKVINRDYESQSAFVQHEIEVNAQAMINISRKRLCNMASPETREAWKAFIKTVEIWEPVLYSICVPDCIYRGYCYEYRSCGYSETQEYADALLKYRRIP